MRRSFPLAFVAVFAAACGSEAPSAPDEATAATADQALEASNPNPALFPKNARPYGVSMERWSELSWKRVESIPLASNPQFDTTGADCAVDQDGPVWFLASVPGSSLGNEVTRSCTVPRHRAVLLTLASLLNDYPCPDPTFQPAPGQTLFEFLRAGAKQAIDGVMGGFEITLDGVPLQDPLQYRYASDDLFHFKGDTSLQGWDNCITGERQVGVADGFYLMFKPMDPGAHTIVVNGHDMMGMHVTLTYHLTVQ